MTHDDGDVPAPAAHDRTRDTNDDGNVPAPAAHDRTRD